MFKKLILAAVLTAGGTLVAGNTAVAGHPHCDNGYGGGYYSNYPPVYQSHYHSYSAHHHVPSYGYGYSGYSSYRPSIGINIGGNPYGYGPSHPGYGYGRGYNSGYRGGSGFSLYLGR